MAILSLLGRVNFQAAKLPPRSTVIPTTTPIINPALEPPSSDADVEVGPPLITGAAALILLSVGAGILVLVIPPLKRPAFAAMIEYRIMLGVDTINDATALAWVAAAAPPLADGMVASNLTATDLLETDEVTLEPYFHTLVVEL